MKMSMYTERQKLNKENMCLNLSYSLFSSEIQINNNKRITQAC